MGRIMRNRLLLADTRTPTNIFSPQRGFTLIELVFAIVVLAVLIGFGIPNLQSYFANQRVRAASLDLLASLTQARSEAVKCNGTVQVKADATGWNGGWTVTSDAGSCFAGETEVSSTGAHNSVNITTAGGLTTITYNPNGRVAGGETFTLCDTNNSAVVNKRSLRVDTSGAPAVTVNGKCNE